ncbi:MAG: hypothetical protein HQK84_03235 [Nitrospinae bacterium]|nr:hypothetical protein [Nitrospinota bacterium]
MVKENTPVKEVRASTQEEEDEKKLLDDAFNNTKNQNDALFNVVLTEEEEIEVINKFFDLDEEIQGEMTSGEITNSIDETIKNDDEIQEAIIKKNKT